MAVGFPLYKMQLFLTEGFRGLQYLFPSCWAVWDFAKEVSPPTAEPPNKQNNFIAK